MSEPGWMLRRVQAAMDDVWLARFGEVVEGRASADEVRDAAMLAGVRAGLEALAVEAVACSIAKLAEAFAGGSDEGSEGR